MDRKYKNPPLVEVLCEFMFIPNQQWDMTIPGIFYEKIKEKFPEKQQQIGLEVGFHPKESKVEQKFEMTIPRMQFFKTDKSALIQIGTDLLVVNHLKPYPSWEIFKPIIFENLNIYKEIANPKGFKQIGLRYINKIDIPDESIEMEDYFNFYPPIPKDLPQEYNSFNINIEIPYKNNNRLLLSLVRAISEKPGIISIILDLYYIVSKPEEIFFAKLDKWIENAHITIKQAFESCITDKCRKIFEEGE